ncbi:MAG: DNA-3-methyladenine glycosylase [Longimicrobiales bacterium]|nr:DNA-3-methyladenine glycosylase [Longimicrobiales bacterium]
MTKDGVSATASWPWRSSSWEGGPEDRLDRSFYGRPAEDVAPDLLGTLLVSDLGGARTSGVIVETEAYVGAGDPASHARESVGRTARNESMFGAPGIAYVYRSYGIHWCLNVVTGEVDRPVAVLIRALDPLEGREIMEERRGRSTELCAGPGRLTQALGITGEHDGHDLSKEPLVLRSGWSVSDDRIGVSGRIGIRKARDWPLRFYLRNHPSVSRSPRG